jgi:hypothetical protein
MNKIENRRYGKLVAALVAVWLAVAVLLSALLVFRADSDSLSLTLLVGALSPVALFLSWFAASPAFRQFALSLNTRAMTIAHSWRIGGFFFLVLASYGILPNVFAQPAGWGDIAIGLTAPLVAIYLARPDHRRSFIAWHALGLLDLVTAVTSGVFARLLADGPSMEPMTVLPLSLVPTFAVPLLTILHIICIAQAAGWERSRSTGFERGEANQPFPAGR